MSELKVYEAYICSHEFLPEEAPKDCEAIVSSNSRYAKDDWWDNAKEFECYLKSEADKVIEEKDAEIARLNAIRKVHIEAIESMGAGLLQDEEEARHHKYKRCLAMARWCERKRIDAANYRIPRQKWDFYDKWHKRWLELAEKFKPNKEAK